MPFFIENSYQIWPWSLVYIVLILGHMIDSRWVQMPQIYESYMWLLSTLELCVWGDWAAHSSEVKCLSTGGNNRWDHSISNLHTEHDSYLWPHPFAPPILSCNWTLKTFHGLKIPSSCRQAVRPHPYPLSGPLQGWAQGGAAVGACTVSRCPRGVGEWNMRALVSTRCL